jgi:tRNA modification GTPase
MDTAGLRDTEDRVEREGVLRTRLAIKQADFIILMLDASQRLGPEEARLLEETAEKRRLIAFNKIDLLSESSWSQLRDDASKKLSGAIVFISAVTGEGLEELRGAVLKQIRSGIVTSGDREAMINARHKAMLLQAKTCLENAISSVDEKAPAELIAVDVRTAVDRLGEITGTTTTDDLLDKIFKEFCIGK